MPIKDPEKKKEAQKRADEKRRGTRALSWNVIVYPESAPTDWRDVLDSEHIRWIESPLHDKDTNPTGELKKAHWHVLLLFDSQKSLEQVKALTERLNAPQPQICKSAKGSVRYMIHMDNPEKYQYDKSDIIAHGGADANEYFAPTSSEIESLIIEMEDFIVKYGVQEYMDLVYYSRQYRSDWHNALMQKSYTIERFIKSLRHAGRMPIDPTTGEVFTVE